MCDSRLSIYRLAFQWYGIVLASFFLFSATKTTNVRAAPIDQGAGAQLYGVVTDGESGLPLNGVQVFYAGTTLGDVSDSEGRYTLPEPPVTQSTVVFSMVGYEVETVSIDFRTLSSFELNISLKTDVIALGGVLVTDERDETWNENLKRFRDVLFSNTPFGNECVIVNPLSLTLEYEDETEILIASTTEPLIIRNPKLGYQVTLHDFSLGSRTLRYHWTGSPQFQELDSNDGKRMSGWIKNRRKAYIGSTRHLMNAFISASLEEEGFYVYDVFNPGDILRDYPVPESTPEMRADTPELERTMVSADEDGLHIFQPYGALLIEFDDESVARGYSAGRTMGRDQSYPLQTSWLKINVGSLFVDWNGNLLMAGAGYPITTYGYMAWERLGELLPFDYNPDINE